MAREQSHPFHFRSLTILLLVIIFFTLSLMMLKGSVTGKVVMGLNGDGIVVTFDKQPIPVGAMVVAHVAGMVSHQQVTRYGKQEQYIIFEEGAMQGYDEEIRVSFESFGIHLPNGKYELTIDIINKGEVIDQKVVDMQIGPEGSVQPTAEQIAAATPPPLPPKDYSARAFYLVLGVVALLISLLFVLFHFRFIPLPMNLFKSPSVSGTLVSKIKTGRAENKSDNQIAKRLQEFALREEIIDAFVMVDGKKLMAYIKAHRKKGYSDAQIQDALERHHGKSVVDAVFDSLE